MKHLITGMVFSLLSLFCTIGFGNNTVNTDSLEQVLVSAPDSAGYKTLLKLYDAYFYSEPIKARQRIEQALQLARKNNWIKDEINTLLSIGVLQFNYEQTDSAILNYQMAMALWPQTKDSLTLARLSGNLGNAYMQLLKYDSAIIYFKKTGDLFERLNNKKGTAKVYGVLGNLNLNIGNLKMAKEYYLKALELNTEIGSKEEVATSKLNLAIILREEGKYQTAIDYNKDAAAYFNQTNNPYYEGMCLSNMATCYRFLKSNNKAMINYSLAAEKFLKVNQYHALAKTNADLADLYSDENKHDLAIVHYRKALSYLVDDPNPETKRKIMESLYLLYKKIGNYSNALDYMEQFHQITDSLSKKSRESKIDSLLTQFESEKKEKEIVLLQKESELQLQKINQQKIMKFFLSSIVLMLVVLVLVVYSRVWLKQKKNEELSLMNSQILLQNEEIMAQRDEIEVQRDHITRQSKSIVSSINYAASIQKAVMPSFEGFYHLFPESFVLFLPRDMVSGDFVWYYRMGNKRIVAAVDCTGHGVPGAFISLLGITFLNEITGVMGITQPHLILNKLREMVIHSLQQEPGVMGSKDGMELSICVIDDTTHEIEYSGAHQDVYFYHQNELKIFKANKMPVGTYIKEDAFTSVKFAYQPSDSLYLFTDGYMDQTGGPEGNKIMSKAFMAMLTEHHSNPMAQQKEFLMNNFEAWKSGNEQIDDVLVIGIRL